MGRRAVVLAVAFLCMTGNLFSTSAAEDNIDVIVSVDGECLADVVMNGENGFKTVSELLADENADKYLSEVKNKQKSVVEEINKRIPRADFSESKYFNTAFSGFTMSVPENKIDKLQSIDGIKAVCVDAKTSEYDSTEALDDNASGEETYATIHELGREIGAEKAYEQGLTGKGILVADIDNGFDIDHEAFSVMPAEPRFDKNEIEQLVSGGEFNISDSMKDKVFYNEKIPFCYDYGDNDTDVLYAGASHGTHTAGIVAGNNGRDYKGVAYDAQLALMKVDLRTGSIMSAIEDAVKLGADVITYSIGSTRGDFSRDIWNEITQNVQNMGIAFVCANGNAGINYSDYYDYRKAYSSDGTGSLPEGLVDYGTTSCPANSPYTYGIGNINIAKAAVADDSSWGVSQDLRLKPDVCASGCNIVSTINNNQYGIMSGTSMSAPFAAGAFAVLKQKYADTESDEADIMSRLMSTADILYYGDNIYSARQQGCGSINLGKAATAEQWLYNKKSNRPVINLGDKHISMSGNTRSLPFDFELTAENGGEKSVTYNKLVISLTVDNRIIGTNTLLPKTFVKELDCDITVEPNSSTELKYTFDFADMFKGDISFKNGMYVDGFVTLVPTESDIQSIHAAYLGYVGDWSALVGIDNTVYDKGGQIIKDYYLTPDIRIVNSSAESVILGYDYYSKEYTGNIVFGNNTAKNFIPYFINSESGGEGIILPNFILLRDLYEARLWIGKSEKENNFIIEKPYISAYSSFLFNGYMADEFSICYTEQMYQKYEKFISSLKDGEYTFSFSGRTMDSDGRLANRQNKNYTVQLDNISPTVASAVLSEENGHTFLTVDTVDDVGAMGAYITLYKGKTPYTFFTGELHSEGLKENVIQLVSYNRSGKSFHAVYDVSNLLTPQEYSPIIEIHAVDLAFNLSDKGITTDVSHYSRDIPGDVTHDGIADIGDALLIARFDSRLSELSDDQIRLGDINNDGSTDIADALMIARADAFRKDP